MTNDNSILAGNLSASDRTRRHRLNIVGDSGPFLILQHGFGTDQSVWRRVLPSLTPQYRVILMDLAGAGPNAAQTFDPQRYDEIESYADDLLLILNDLAISECLYVGSSLGAMIGILAAIERPELFRKLICIGASPHYLNDNNYKGGFDQHMLDGIYQMMSDDYHGWVSGFAPLVVRGGSEPDAVSEFALSLFSLRPDISLSTARAIFQSDFRQRVSLLKTPTVLLQTQNDAAVPLAVAEFLRDHIQNATLEIIQAEGHFPHLSSPSVVSDALIRHLQ
jgi:sigma-B regulation protein RsbQ